MNNNSRNNRAIIAQETLNILNNGWYINSYEEHIDIKDIQGAAVERSIHYPSSKTEQILKELTKHSHVISKFELTSETTLECAYRKVVREGHKKTICLNFASAKNPGGGFLGGSQAQEETLARSSGLFPCIAQFHDFYQKNRSVRTCLYTDDMIYSPMVPIIRYDDGQLLNSPYLLSILTAPAVNAGALQSNEPQRVNEIEAVMLGRIEKLLALMAKHQYDTIILGAWGCGVFKNDPRKIAYWFKKQLLNNPQFQNRFQHIVFAIPDSSLVSSIRQVFHDNFQSVLQ